MRKKIPHRIEVDRLAVSGADASAHWLAAAMSPPVLMTFVMTLFKTRKLELAVVFSNMCRKKPNIHIVCFAEDVK